ncbi:MAG: hypothetical protein U5K54_21760 [Cytophagales bacterium]|nr:hypothetical protein [Cytophagales bacterium]
MRVIFILSGIELIHRFHWLVYIFGGFLVITGIRMLKAGEAKLDEKSTDQPGRRILTIYSRF